MHRTTPCARTGRAASTGSVSRPAVARVAATLFLPLALVAGACSTSDDGGATGASRSGTGAAPTTSVTTSSVAAAPATADRTVYPGADWATATAAEAGMDQAALDRVAATAQAGGSNCLVVTRAGKLVGEWYWNGTGPDSAQEVYSATKSFTSTLVGMAQADGDLSIGDSASTFLPQWKGSPSEAVTVRNLLSNDSGRHYDFKTDYVEMAAKADDKTAFAVGLGQDAPPGTVWRYNNSAIQTLSGVLRSATGTPVDQFARTRLFEPIGMAASSMKTDRSGNALTFMGVQSTCRDMARYGYLMLRTGNWDGTQIVPASWVQEATGGPSQDLNGNYGYLWWLNRGGDGGAAAQATGQRDGEMGNGGQMAPGAPDDMYFALGLGGQIIAIDPGSETVVVRLGPVGGPAGAPAFGASDAAAVVTQAVTGP